MSLTGIVVNIPRGAGTPALKKQWKEADVETKWSNSSFQKSRERSIRRKQLNDFERFKVMRLRKQVCVGLQDAAFQGLKTIMTLPAIADTIQRESAAHANTSHRLALR